MASCVPIIPEVVEKFLECGDLARGFARIRCDHCKEDRLLAFSCKGRGFCPSCHQKKVQLFGALLAESILGLQRPPRTPGALPRAQGHGTARPIHHRQPLFGRKDADDRAGPGFGIRMDPLPLRHGNKKIGRNFAVFTPCDFIAAITQHIADKSFQLVRYYGWYSNKMRGRRAKQADEEVPEGDAVELIDVSAHEPRRISSKKWRELIKKVWEADPLRCPKCSREIRIVSLIDQEDVIERILRHLGLWQGVRVHSGTDPPGETTLDPWVDDPFPDYDTEPIVAFSAS
jgi:hypothetical protein